MNRWPIRPLGHPVKTGRARRRATDPGAYQPMATAVKPYGDGTAAEKIVQFLATRLSAA